MYLFCIIVVFILILMCSVGDYWLRLDKKRHLGLVANKCVEYVAHLFCLHVTFTLSKNSIFGKLKLVRCER